MSDEIRVVGCYTEPGEINERWPERFFVDIVAARFPYRGEYYPGVNLRLFRPIGDMPKSEARELLAACGFTRPDVYLTGYVGQTFDIGQVQELVSYFVNWPIDRIAISPAAKPRDDIMGVEAISVGGGQDFYAFSDCDDWPLSFKVWGYFDIRHHDEWIKPFLDAVGDSTPPPPPPPPPPVGDKIPF